MKHKIGVMAVVLAAALLVLASPVRQARADDGAGQGFWYGETHPCQVCTEAQMADHNQLALQGTDPGTHVPYNYWNPVPGEPGRLILCGYRSSATSGGLTTLYPIYYKRSGRV